MRGGDRVGVLLPHAEGVADAWVDDGVEVRSFRYAPESWEVLGYGRSLAADERIKGKAALAAPLYLLGASRALGRELRSRRVDLVQAHWVVPNALAAARFHRRVPIAVGLHGSDVFLAEKGPVRPAVRWALRRCGVMTGCSPELVERVCEIGFDRSRSRVIPYGVDSEVFRPDRLSGMAWRKKLGIPEKAPMVLSVGRMATKKGYQVLLDGLDELFARHPDAHLVLAGSGDRLEEFRERADPWIARVHFPGAVYRGTLPDLYRAADLFVLPAVHDPAGNVDGLPNVILEAMATGLPVVATDISGIPIAIEDGREGRLVPEQDPVRLVSALDELLSDPDRSREMGQTARRKAVTTLSWDAVAARYRDAYEEAIRRKNGPAAA